MCVKSISVLLDMCEIAKENALAICAGISYTFPFLFAGHSVMI
jgi:hypothetical protein